MTSFIILGSDTETKAYAHSLCEEKKISALDITTISTDKDSVGIGIIKKIQEKVFLKPLQSNDKAVIIPEAETLTIPAQNSLLKLLEEPPIHTYLFLLAATIESLLPTIQSRCKIIKLQRPVSSMSAGDKDDNQTLYTTWTKHSLGESLKSAENLAKDKDRAIRMLQTMTIFVRTQMLQAIAENVEASTFASHLKQIQTALKLLTSTNTNPRLILEHLFLNFN